MINSNSDDEFNRKVGEILRIALNIESFLDYAITNYFMGHSKGKIPFENQSGKRAFFQESVAYKMKFEKKRQLFKEICDKKKCDPIKFKETIDNLNFISSIRNKVAHDDMRRNDKEGHYLVRRDSLAPYDYKTPLSNELMAEVQNKWLNVIKSIMEFSKSD